MKVPSTAQCCARESRAGGLEDRDGGRFLSRGHRRSGGAAEQRPEGCEGAGYGRLGEEPSRVGPRVGSDPRHEPALLVQSKSGHGRATLGDAVGLGEGGEGRAGPALFQVLFSLLLSLRRLHSCSGMSPASPTPQDPEVPT